MESAKSVCKIISRIYSPGMRILDVGCGAGHYLRSLRGRVDRDIDYSGVDLNEHYIELARDAFPDVDQLSVGDARDLGFDGESFDIVLCMNVIPNLPPPPAKAISELLRVSRSHVIIRTLFSEMTYIIRELTSNGEDDSSLISSDGQFDEEQALYNNMYSESYLCSVIGDIDPNIKISIESDANGAPIDNRSIHGSWGTRTELGKQISGQLILDWRFVILTKNGSVTP